MFIAKQCGNVEMDTTIYPHRAKPRGISLHYQAIIYEIQLCEYLQLTKSNDI